MKDDDFINTRLPDFTKSTMAAAERQLKEIARTLKDAMPPGFGFTLFIFEYGDEVNHGTMFYASSAERPTMLKVLKEFIAKEEQQQ